MNARNNNFKTASPVAPVNLVQTAGFLHDAGDTAILRFRSSGDTPRMLMAFIAQGRFRDGDLDRTLNGITIVDIDNAKVVATKIKSRNVESKGVSGDQRFGLAILETLEWENFASYCRNANTYRGNIPDICAGQGVPDIGNTENQKRVGPDFMPQIDIRSAFLSILEQDPEVPYSFPQTTRDNAIFEIMTRERFNRDDGQFHLASDIRMGFKWNKSGVVEGGLEVSDEYDQAWKQHYEADPELFHKACESVLAPFLALDFTALDLGEHATCHLDVMGTNLGHLVLKEFSGEATVFASDQALRDHLEAMPVGDLANLWATLRVIDVDLCVNERVRLMEAEINEMRAVVEEDWSLVHDQESLCA